MSEMFGEFRILPSGAISFRPRRGSVRRRVRQRSSSRFRFDRYRPPARWTITGLTFSALDHPWRILDCPPQPSPEHVAREDENRRQRELDEMARREAQGQRHRNTVDRCDDYVLHDVAALHAPDDCDDCMGCDEEPPWPCTTFRLIEAGVNPDAPERVAEKAKEKVDA